MNNMVTFGCSQRVCGACRYWQGQKKINLSRTYVDADVYERARCAGGDGSRNPQDTSASESCGQWQSVTE